MELSPYHTFMTEFLLLCRIIYRDIRYGNFFPEPLIFLQPFADLISAIWSHHANNKKKSTQPESSDCQQQCSALSQNYDNNGLDDLSIEEIKMVMNKLGLEYLEDTKNKDHEIGENKIPLVFDQEEPSLDEIKEAFDVFDANGDGFIDKEELQRVLYNLGQLEGTEIEECRKMISRFDENGDGLIDFKEFIRIMEKSFC